MADKKYYVKPMESDWYDGEVYYGEDQAAEDLFGAGGNRDFGTINAPLLDGIDKSLEDAYYDIDNLNTGSDDDDDYYGDEEDVAKEVVDIIKSYFSPLPDGSALSNSDINKLIELVYQYSEARGDEETEVICKVLEIFYKKPFTYGTMRGYSQGDGMDYICPVDLMPRLSYIEAVLMGTGTEFAISTEKIDFPTDGSDVDCYYDYTDLGRDNDVIEGAAHNIGCSTDEVVLLDADGELK